ncbi:MAG: DUF364 domain-containing protein [Candidatus Bathyarchaeota archaeon]|nr:DUF364 domain-containing protein [Candidatus Bathyarchaeota archaeon]
MVERIVEKAIKKIEAVTPNLDEIIVNQAVLGLGYTAVKLSSGHAGLCYTFETEVAQAMSHCQKTNFAGTIAGTPACKVAEKAKSWDVNESILGLATLNALSQIAIEKNPDNYTFFNGDALDHIKLTKEDTVALVGCIKPFIKPIQEKVKKLYVLERTVSRREEGILPDTACDQILPTADVVLITGTAIANGTIDHLLNSSTKAKEIAIIGPSAGILPEVLFEHGATIIGGVKIIDTDKMMQIVSEGGGTPALKAAMQFVTIKPKQTH